MNNISNWMVEIWNKTCPVGTEVVLTDDFGDKIETKTTSEAWIVGDEPVVCVEGKRGGYMLKRITPKEKFEEICDSCDGVVSCEQCCVDAGK